MGRIRSSSATVATLYITFLAFVILCLYNFIPTTEPFGAQNFSYGIAFLLLSASGLLSGFTSGDVDDPFLRALLVCVSAMWGALGTFYITRSNTGSNAYLLGVPVAPYPAHEALFPGYGAFLFIFLIFGFSCIQHRNYFTAVLSLGLFLCSTFEIAALWHEVRMSVGAYYLLLGVVSIYMVAKMLVDKLRGKNYRTTPKRLMTDDSYSNDYMTVGYAMDVVTFAVFASRVTGATTIANNGFMWVGSAGIFQTICGGVAIRRKDSYCGSLFILYGVFWFAVSFNLGLNHFSPTHHLPLLTVNIFFVIVFVLTGFISLIRELFQSLQNLLLAIFTTALCVNGVQGRFLGGMSWVCFILSLYGLAAHTGRLKPTHFKLPLGRRLFDRIQLKQCLLTRFTCCAKLFYVTRRTDQTTRSNDRLFSTDFTDMGYSKYLDLDTIGFAVNAVSALSIIWIPDNSHLLALPWMCIVGGMAQMVVGCISFSRGLTFESCSFIVFSTMWLILGTARSLGVLAEDNSMAMGIGSIAYMITGLLLIGLSLVISKAWFLVTFLFELIALSFLLDSLGVSAYKTYEIIVVLLFTLVCVYCFLASAFKSIWGRQLLPLGSPIIQVSYLHSQGNRAFWAHAQKQSGVMAIADIMNRGGIAGIPTDTVYVLAAAVKFPHAVERAYQTKKLAEDRPMSMWISNLNQLAAAREKFGERLWDFMNAVWPSTISCVVNKGPWLDSLGIGSASKYVGRPDSIAVRMPDNVVTTFLIDQTGPVATTSANPTGEADTTHHLQVLAKLGLKNCDGILCDGSSFANSASTVVDCRKIDEWQIGFFRIGLVSKSQVEQIFEQVRAKHNSDKSMSPHLTLHSAACDRGPEFGGHINAAFEEGDDDENDKPHGDSDDHSFGEVKHNSKESDIRACISEELSRKFVDPVDTSLVTSSKKGKQEKQEPDQQEDERINQLITNLRDIMNDLRGQRNDFLLEPEVNESLSKCKYRSTVSDEKVNTADNYDNDDDYEKMNFKQGINSTSESLTSHKALNEVLGIVDSNDAGSDEPLTSLKSRRRRELQEEINNCVLNRGDKTSDSNGSSKRRKNLDNSSNGIYTTTLKVNIDQNGHAHQPTHPFNGSKEYNHGGKASGIRSSTPLLEHISFQKPEHRERNPRRLLDPPIKVVDNDVAVLEVENGEKTHRNQFDQSLVGSRSEFPDNQDGVYSFTLTERFEKRISDRPKQTISPPMSPLFERITSLTQRTQL